MISIINNKEEKINEQDENEVNERKKKINKK